MAPIPLSGRQKGSKAHFEILGKIFRLRFLLSLGLLVVLWGMVKTLTFGRMSGWGRISFIFTP